MNNRYSHFIWKGCLLACLISCTRNDYNKVNENDYRLAVGASSHGLLSNESYQKLIVDLQYVPGYQPSASAVNHLQQFLSSLLNKPGGIQIQQNALATSFNNNLTLSSIRSIEDQYRKVFSSGQQMSIFILITDGYYSDNKVLGLAYNNSSICLFGKNLHDHSGATGQPGRSVMEAAVLEHETGHLLGLVDKGSPMQTFHKDTAHGSHCNNRDCLMYYAAETSDAAGFLAGSQVPVLDAACLSDLEANGSK